MPEPEQGPASAAAGGILAGQRFDPKAWDAQVQASRDAIFKIGVTSCDGTASGSGFAVDAHTVITNAHVTEGMTTAPSITDANGHRYDTTSVRLALGHDLASLHVRQALPHWLTLGRSATPGDRIRAAGFPLGGPFAADEGHVIAKVPGLSYGEPDHVLQLSSDIRPGNSGGPVLRPDGTVAGVIFAIDLHNDASLAFPASDVLADLGNEQDALLRRC